MKPFKPSSFANYTTPRLDQQTLGSTCHINGIGTRIFTWEGISEAAIDLHFISIMVILIDFSHIDFFIEVDIHTSRCTHFGIFVHQDVYKMVYSYIIMYTFWYIHTSSPNGKKNI